MRAELEGMRSENPLCRFSFFEVSDDSGEILNVLPFTVSVIARRTISHEMDQRAKYEPRNRHRGFFPQSHLQDSFFATYVYQVIARNQKKGKEGWPFAILDDFSITEGDHKIFTTLRGTKPCQEVQTLAIALD